MSSQGFGVWITGIPASGKSSIARALVAKLRDRGVSSVVLESDEMRRILTPEPGYGPEERDRFYRALALLGEMITKNGVNVIFDATANRRRYRDEARSRIPIFMEVYVACPLTVCVKRDPKGIYARAASGEASTVPGLQDVYEPPAAPEATVDGQQPPDESAEAIIEKLRVFHAI